MSQTKTIRTSDSCTLTMKGQKLPVLPVGTVVQVTLNGETITGKSGYSTEYQLCFAKDGSSKALHTLLSKGFVKGQTQEVEITVEE